MKADDRISKDCQISDADETRVTCSKINLGFSRNFQTDSYVQDLQFSYDMGETDFSTFGWIYDSGRFWHVTKKKANNYQEDRSDLATIRVVS